jgi:sugar lactone lactonase YvrE
VPFENPQIRYFGHGLNRPECVLAHESGLVLVPDWSGQGGVSAIFPDGSVKRHLATASPFPLKPNGIALADGGDILITHLGGETGGVWRLRPDGSVAAELTEIDNVPLPPSNFCHLDAKGRQWLSVSTRHIPRADAYRGDVADGFIVLRDAGGARIVAEGLGYANECLVHPDGERLFVNETFGRRLTCFDITPDGSLSNGRTIAEFGSGTYPDGMAFDANGDIWIVSIVSNRVIRIDDAGEQNLFIEDADGKFVDAAEKAFLAGEMGRPHLDGNPARHLRNISSLAFDGPGLDRMVLGCLLGERLAYVQSPVRGWPMPHFHTDITPLLAALGRSPAVLPFGATTDQEKEN